MDNIDVEKEEFKTARDSKWEILEKENEIIYDQLTFADNKCNFVFAASIALLIAIVGTFFGLRGNLYLEANLEPANITLWFFFSYWTLGFALSSIFSIAAIKPNLSKNEDNIEANVFFFGDISKFKSSGNLDKSANEQKMLKDLFNQNVEVSKIIIQKNRLCNVSCIILINTIFPLYFLIFFIVKMAKKVGKKGKD
jgi:hypothetical protein